METQRRERWTDKASLLLTPALTEGEGGVWADLGCGDGIFIFLLCEVLTAGSHIYVGLPVQTWWQGRVKVTAPDGLWKNNLAAISASEPNTLSGETGIIKKGESHAPKQL